jgi:alkylation response protein AidB-like acyl-CoA dehydrogenase
MDFGFTEEQESLRQEVRAFLKSDSAQVILREILQRPFREELFSRELYNMIADRGWLTLHWPKKYGGGGKSMIENGIVIEECVRAGVPHLAWLLTITIFGNAVLRLGTDEQRTKYLPLISKGEILCNVLYTEPDAGSDLANLRARACPDGDDWVINGTKIYNSCGHLADHGLIVVRTDPDVAKHKGLTLFIVDMHASGVTVSPMWSVGDERFDEVVFEDVRVPKEHMIGALNQGWNLMNQLLAVERTGLELTTRTEYFLNSVIALIKEKSVGRNSYVRQRIAELYSEVQLARMLSWRVIAYQAHGEINDVYSAMSKMYGTDLGKQIVRLGMEIGGLDGLLTRWDQDPICGGLQESFYREAPLNTVGAGTSEIMLHIIAYRGLKVHK